MTTVSEKTLTLIKDEHLRPISRRRLALQWLLIWFLVLLFILIGSLVVSVVFYGLLDTDWDVFLQIGISFADELVGNAPIFILLCALIFTLIASLVIRSTRNGYHYRRRWLVASSLSLSLLLGFLIQLAGFGTEVDEFADSKIPAYISTFDREMKLWQNPDYGLLTGTIETISGNTVLLRDPAGNNWTVDLPQNMDVEQLIQSDCKNIKIVGTRQNQTEFLSKEIRPWTNKYHTCLPVTP